MKIVSVDVELPSFVTSYNFHPFSSCFSLENDFNLIFSAIFLKQMCAGRREEQGELSRQAIDGNQVKTFVMQISEWNDEFKCNS